MRFAETKTREMSSINAREEEEEDALASSTDEEEESVEAAPSPAAAAAAAAAAGPRPQVGGALAIACPTGAMASDFEANLAYVDDYHKRHGSMPPDREWWLGCHQKRISYGVMGRKHMVAVRAASGPVRDSIMGGWKGAWPVGQEPQGITGILGLARSSRATAN